VIDGATGEVVEEGGLDPRVAHILRTVGIHQPSKDDPLHVALVDAIWRTLGGSYGAQLIAMRFEVAQALKTAGTDFAKAKTSYEHFIDKETVRAVAGPDKVTRALAEQMARASDEGYRLQLAALVAEKHEQWLRKLLDTFAAAADNHRTDRADERAASSFQASGHVPEQR
jgi:hypothetical protein